MRREDDSVRFPSAVEDALRSYRFVTGAVVEGDPRAGTVRAVVSIDQRAAVSVEALLHHVAARVRADWVPTEVSFVSAIEPDLEPGGGWHDRRLDPGRPVRRAQA